MCSVQDGGAVLVKKEHVVSVGGKCMKCGAVAVAIARTKDPFCKDCFHAYMVHRFRSTFGKSRLVTSGEKVLLAFSGGQGSCVMLALSEEGLSQQVHKKLRYVPTVIYIDEGAAIGMEYENRCEILAKVMTIATNSGFPTIFTQLEQVYGSYEVCSADQLFEDRGPEADRTLLTTHDSERGASSGQFGSTDQLGATESAGSTIDKNKDVPQLKTSGRFLEMAHRQVFDFMTKRRNTSLEEKLREAFENTKTHTAKENLLLSLRQHLLSEIARKSGCRKVLLGVNATQLAVRLLSNVAQGRGATLPLDVGFSDDRSNDVMFLRPLREFPSTEVSTFVDLHQLKTVAMPTLTNLSSDKTSIDHLTTSFVTGLQADFPSTVHTVFRTGDKLTVGRDSSDGEHSTCSLCQAPLTQEANPYVFSHLSVPSDFNKDVWRGLCYGCRLTVKDMKDGASSLPSFVLHSSKSVRDSLPSADIGDASNQDAMKDQIKDFLLTDS